MVKRALAAGGLQSSDSRAKRARTTDRFSNLSDELLLRILSNLSIHDLAVCQRVSSRLEHIAGDSQLWRARYFDRFIRPRLQLSKRNPSPAKLARWLDEGDLVRRGRATNWKRQYRLRHKWSNGTCGVEEILVPGTLPPPPLLARLHKGIVYTVDSAAGLRAWSYKGERKLLASCQLTGRGDPPADRVPTAITVDSRVGDTEVPRFAVGYDDGSFDIIEYHEQGGGFVCRFSHPQSCNGKLVALSYASPYLLSMSESQTLSLYRWEYNGGGTQIDNVTLGRLPTLDPPRLLISLKSHTVWPPLSLSLRLSETRIVAAIAYCMPTFNSGWTVGVQEVHLSTSGEVIYSRLASALGHGCSLADSLRVTAPITARPTSLSYSHPYLLVSHADNTLTLYMVTSTVDRLFVGPGKRLWGHTSGVFGAHVGGRGKAVSVSARGSEIRVWELEESSVGRPGQRQPEASSIRVTPDKTGTRQGIQSCAESARCGEDVSVNITRAYVGFDDERVVVLREHEHGRQALAVYDFS